MEKSTLNSETFESFLSMLAPDGADAGVSYERLRMKLAFFFESRGCASVSDLIDATIDRSALRMFGLKSNGEVIRDPVSYIYGVARFIFLEYIHHPERRGTSLDGQEVPDDSNPRFDEDSDERERMDEALERCLQRLGPEQRRLIREFYQGEKLAKKQARVRLARSLGITKNALSLRAFQIRKKLAACLEMGLAAA